MFFSRKHFRAGICSLLFASGRQMMMLPPPFPEEPISIHVDTSSKGQQTFETYAMKFDEFDRETKSTLETNEIQGGKFTLQKHVKTDATEGYLILDMAATQMAKIGHNSSLMANFETRGLPLISQLRGQISMSPSGRLPMYWQFPLSEVLVTFQPQLQLTNPFTIPPMAMELDYAGKHFGATYLAHGAVSKDQNNDLTWTGSFSTLVTPNFSLGSEVQVTPDSTEILAGGRYEYEDSIYSLLVPATLRSPSFVASAAHKAGPKLLYCTQLQYSPHGSNLVVGLRYGHPRFKYIVRVIPWELTHMSIDYKIDRQTRFTVSGTLSHTDKNQCHVGIGLTHTM